MKRQEVQEKAWLIMQHAETAGWPSYQRYNLEGWALELSIDGGGQRYARLHNDSPSDRRLWMIWHSYGISDINLAIAPEHKEWREKYLHHLSTIDGDALLWEMLDTFDGCDSSGYYTPEARFRVDACGEEMEKRLCACGFLRSKEAGPMEQHDNRD